MYHNWPQSYEEITYDSTMSWSRVTMVIPSFNQAQYLENTIRSVLHQQYPDLELIVIDGGSTDGSIQILEKYDHEITYWVSEPDRGQAHAINKGWQRAAGEYVWWLNSDDMLAPGALKKAVEFLQLHPETAMVYGDVVLLHVATGTESIQSYLPFDFDRFILEWHDISQAGALVRGCAIKKIGLLDESKHFLMDRDYWIRLVLAGEGIVYLAQPLALFRVHDAAKTSMGSPQSVRERYEVTRMVLGNSQVGQRFIPWERRIWASVHMHAARVYMKCGMYRESLAELWKALVRKPGLLFTSSTLITLSWSLPGFVLGHVRIQKLRGWIRNIRHRRNRLNESGHHFVLDDSDEDAT